MFKEEYHKINLRHITIIAVIYTIQEKINQLNKKVQHTLKILKLQAIKHWLIIMLT